MRAKKEGFIAPRGPRWPGTGPNGKEWALSGDIDVCDCSPSPLFHAERNMTMSFTAEEVAKLMGQSSTGSSSVGNKVPGYDEQVRVVADRVSIAGYPYSIETASGDVYCGRVESLLGSQVTRRTGLSAIFFILGFVSFWIVGALDSEICRYFPSVCRPKSGVCAELGKCGSSPLRMVEVFAVYLGPSVAFAVIAAIFSAQRRGFCRWLILAVSLVFVHLLLMEGLRFT
jgi:hypothetical protein